MPFLPTCQVRPARHGAGMAGKPGRPHNGVPLRPTGVSALPTIYDLKPRFRAPLRPAADALARAGTTRSALGLSPAHRAWLALLPQSRCLIGPYLTPMDFRWSALAGGIIGISGFLGDITMSAMKRDLGVQDTGGVIPGHGGILDRVDSLTYAAPVFVDCIRYFFYP